MHDKNYLIPGLGFIQRVQVLTERGNDTLVFVRVFPENVLDDDDGFLDYIVDLGLDQVKQCAYAPLCSLLNLHSKEQNFAVKTKLNDQKIQPYLSLNRQY